MPSRTQARPHAGRTRPRRAGSDRTQTSLTGKIRALLAVPRDPQKTPPTLQEVAEGTGLSVSYLTMLKAGRRSNPTVQTVRRLAAFFAIPVAYFYEDVSIAALKGLTSAQEVETLVNQASVQAAAGRLTEAEEALDQAMTNLEPILSPKLWARGTRVRGQIARLRRDWDRAILVLQEALEFARRIGTGTEFAETSLELGRAEYEQQHYSAARRYFRQALTALEEMGRGKSDPNVPSLRMQTLYALGIVERRLGHPEESAHRFREALTDAPEAVDPHRLAHLHLGLSLALKDLDHADAALAASAQALEIYRTLEDLKLIADTQHNMALVHLTAERLEDARSLLERSNAMHRALGDARGIAHDDLAFARYCSRTAQLTEAQRWATRALEGFQAEHMPEQAGDALVLLAEIADQAGDREETRRKFEEAFDVLETHDLPSNLAQAVRRFADLVARWGWHEEATQLYRRSLQAYETLPLVAG